MKNIILKWNVINEKHVCAVCLSVCGMASWILNYRFEAAHREMSSYNHRKDQSLIHTTTQGEAVVPALSRY